MNPVRANTLCRTYTVTIVFLFQALYVFLPDHRSIFPVFPTHGYRHIGLGNLQAETLPTSPIVDDCGLTQVPKVGTMTSLVAGVFENPVGHAASAADECCEQQARGG